MRDLGLHDVDYEVYCPLKHDIMQSGIFLLTFQRHLLHAALGQKRRGDKMEVASSSGTLLNSTGLHGITSQNITFRD